MMNRLDAAARQDIPDLIAGALGVSRGTAYDMMREALAEQQAAKPVIEVEISPMSTGGTTATVWSHCLPVGTHKLYTHPAPTQQTAEPVAITEAMAFAFHSAITDGALGSDDLMDIMRGLEAAFAHITGPQAPTQQPLTDEEICRIGAQVHGFLLCNEGQWGLEMGRAIEAAVLAKNGITGSKKGGAA
jgi:hypothetical protein